MVGCVAQSGKALCVEDAENADERFLIKPFTHYGKWPEAGMVTGSVRVAYRV
jgi:hypothetical protein